MFGMLLFLVLIILIVSALPTWGYSRDWGYYPAGGLGLVLIIILLLALFGAFPVFNY